MKVVVIPVATPNLSSARVRLNSWFEICQIICSESLSRFGLIRDMYIHMRGLFAEVSNRE